MIWGLPLLILPGLLFYGVPAYLGAVNAAAFLLFGYDKLMAVKGRWRVPENVLVLWALCGGAWGGLLGMVFFHHKTGKVKVWLPVVLFSAFYAILFCCFGGCRLQS